MKKLYAKCFLSVFLSVMLTFLSTINVFAASQYELFRYKLNGGVGNWGYNKRYYWIDSSASRIEDLITEAYHDWIYTSDILETPISWRETSTKSQGTVEFYTYKDDDNSNGYMNFWLYSTQVDADSQNWGWCTVYYNNKYSAGKATLAHEIGHTMGLDENNSNTRTIMCQEGAGRIVDSPRAGDLQGINAKYT